MKSQEEIEEAYEQAAQVAQYLDESEKSFEAMAPIIVTRTLRWVTDNETEEEGDLFEEIEDFIDELEDE
jgi:transcriptional/translational regulatory protein YebC/TACO1